MRRVFLSKILPLCFLLAILGTGQSRAEAFSSKIDVLKGEKWWGVFVAGGQMMPFDKPFPKTDLGTWIKSQTTPFLISSRGRYIWSNAPFTIEYTGENFLIDSPAEKVDAVTAGKTLREAYLVCCHRNFPPDGNLPAMELFTAPVYDAGTELGFGATATDLNGYADKILAEGYPAGTLVVPSGWQATTGNLTPDEHLYGDFSQMVGQLHAKGFKVMLTVTPFVSSDGPIYRAYRRSDAFVRLKNGQPAMAEWTGGYSAFYDLTQPQVFEMLCRQIDTLRTVYGVDGFLFDCQGALPFIQYAKGGAQQYLTQWSKLGGNCNFCQYTISRGAGFAPYVHNLQAGDRFDWKFLQDVTADIITANLLGYPYSTVSTDDGDLSGATDPLLLLRYIQLSSALPVMNIGFAPWRMSDPGIAKLCKEAVNKRIEMSEYCSKLIQESARTAEPIIRHMEYEFPRNGFTDCNDQFMIGSKYLIAPLLTAENSRIVRFPRGTWVDAQGKKYKGPLVATVLSPDNRTLIFESSK